MAIKKFKIEASEQAKQLAKKPVKSAAGKRRWGLYSDFGQRILNETFDSKREAQKAFREYGYTKDSEAWIEEVDETAVGKFDKKPANSACGKKKSVKASMDSDLRNAGLKYNEDFSEGPYAAFAENAMAKGYVVHKFENGGVYPDGVETDFRTAMKFAKKYNIQYEYEYNQGEDMYSLPQIRAHIKQDGEFYAVGDNGKKYKASYDSRRKVMYYAIPSDVEIIGYIPIDNIDSACGKKIVKASGAPNTRGSEVLENGWVIQKIRNKWYLMSDDEYEKYKSNLEAFPKDGMVTSFPSKIKLIQQFLREPFYKGMFERSGYSLDKNWNVIKDKKSVKAADNTIKRYSDVVPKEDRKYWYFTTHGLGPGMIPRGVNVLKVQEGQNKNGTWGDFVLLDAILNTDELKQYDLIELAPKDVNASTKRKPMKQTVKAAEGRFAEDINTESNRSVLEALCDTMFEEFNGTTIGDVTIDVGEVRPTVTKDAYKFRVFFACPDYNKDKELEVISDANSGKGGFICRVSTEPLVFDETFELKMAGSRQKLSAKIREIAEDLSTETVGASTRRKPMKKFVKASASAKRRASIRTSGRYDGEDGSGILNFEIFKKSDEVTGAKRPVTCSEDGPLCVCDSCLAGIESHEGRQVIYDEIYSDADYGEPPLICDWCGDEVEKLYQITPGERIESAEQPVKADGEKWDGYRDDIDASAKAVKCSRSEPDDRFQVQGYIESNFRGLMEDEYFNDFEDAKSYAHDLLMQGYNVVMSDDVSDAYVEITADEYQDKFDGEFVVNEDIADFQDEVWRSMGIDASKKPINADFNDIEDIEDFYDGENFDNTKALGAFNSDTAPYDVNTTVAEYITDNYGIYAESVSYVEYNGPGDWVVDMSQSGQAVADDFVYFLSEKDYDLSLKLYGESETDASGYDMKDYYGDNAIHGKDFQFQFYPAQNQWSAPQVDVDINELIQIGLTQEEANRVVDLVAEYEQNYISICQDINYYIESFLKELSEEEVKASTGVKAALGNKNKTDYASNPIYELDKYVKDLAEGVAAAAGITLTYQVSDEAITFIDGDGTAVFIQPISEITPEPDDLENDIQELVSAIQYEDSDNPEYWPTDTSEDDPDYATRAVQMSVDDELEPVMGEGEDIGFGVDSYGETIDESTVSELYRIAEKEILPNTELAQIDPYVSIDEDSWDFYFGGVSNAGMMGVVKFYIHFKLTSDNIDLNEYVLPDAKLYPDFKYYKASLDFDIYTENGKVTDVVLESADIYKSDNSYDDHFSGKFGEAFNTEALENYIEKLAAPAAEEIYNAVSNL